MINRIEKYVGMFICLFLLLIFNSCMTTKQVKAVKQNETEPTAPPSVESCRNGKYSWQEEYDTTCVERFAKEDNLKAIKILLKEKWGGRYVHGKREDPEWFYWTMKAAELGDKESLEEVIKEFNNDYGIYPRNEARLKHFIEIGVKNNHIPSMLAKAAFVQDIDPDLSAQLYEEISSRDDCKGHLMLAYFYENGISVPMNQAKSYYLYLAAKRIRYSRDGLSSSEIPYFPERAYAVLSGNLDKERYFFRSEVSCSDLFRYASENDANIFDVKRYGNMSFAREVNDLFIDWRPGKNIPKELDKYDGITLAEEYIVKKDIAPKSKEVKNVEFPSWGRWKPLELSITSNNTLIMDAQQLYEKVSNSVFVIVASSSRANLKSLKNISQGSAVAVDEDILITNYHVIEGKPLVYLVTSSKLERLTIVSVNKELDMCILSTKINNLHPVDGLRTYNSLSVGETVYAIGSPKGFSNSISKGIVSQLRQTKGRYLIQTTAQISGGSSGGGLFDEFGNLMGITTFKIVDSEGLNFAISAEQFVK